MNFRIPFYILLVAAFISCKKEIKKIIPKPYSVSGKVHISLENKNIKLIAYNSGKPTIIDATTIKNQQFYLNSKKNVMALSYVFIEGVVDSLPVISSENALELIIDDATYKHVDFGSNVIQKQYNTFKKNFVKQDNAGNTNYTYASNFVKVNTDSELATIIVNSLKNDESLSFKQFETLFASLDSVQQHSSMGYILQKYISTEKKVLQKLKHTADSIALANKKPTVIRRLVAPLFTGENANGGDYSLSSLIAKNKVVIIDFWASWCGPCRISNPTLVKLYKKYKHRGLGIVSVSEDKDINAWKNAISKDNLTWPQIIDDSQRIAFMYNVSSIPHVVVLDSHGGFLRRKTTTGKLEADIIKLLNE